MIIEKGPFVSVGNTTEPKQYFGHEGIFACG